MDPDATLTDVLEEARRIADGYVVNTRAVDLARDLLALDEWIAKGGYLPARWRGEVQALLAATSVRP